SLINDRAICAQDSANVPGAENIRALRATTNVLGDGFVEAIDSNTLLAIANNQPGQSGGQIAGTFIQVPVSEAPGQVRGGRFGWKNQQASLLSFAADAYVNEQGVTSRLQPNESTTVCDTVADPEDHPDAAGLADIDHFARFMRATQVPPVDATLAATSDAKAGASLFNAIGCNICHVTSITTAPAGTVINGGAFTVPAALGSKIIHPYSDFLLHNVGTGDGIVQNGGQVTANMMRTVPLWGGRTRDRLMHDLLSFTRNDAILRHAGEATGVINNYRSLSTTQKNQLITFLQSL
ncbi:MAG TPA: di-heme oxidoredictase family protein, partial [Candidatus Binatia bacterium]|nr:di-heme oxidoredictase family protein [Candidatus Binatia bacterium]